VNGISQVRTYKNSFQILQGILRDKLPPLSSRVSESKAKQNSAQLKQYIVDNTKYRRYTDLPCGLVVLGTESSSLSTGTLALVSTFSSMSWDCGACYSSHRKKDLRQRMKEKNKKQERERRKKHTTFNLLRILSNWVVSKAQLFGFSRPIPIVSCLFLTRTCPLIPCFSFPRPSPSSHP